MSTINVADDIPDPNEDCITLRAAMDDIGVKKNKLMGVICHRNQEQRSKIRHMYGGKYEEDLVQRLRRKLHGNLEISIFLQMSLYGIISCWTCNKKLSHMHAHYMCQRSSYSMVRKARFWRTCWLLWIHTDAYMHGHVHVHQRENKHKDMQTPVVLWMCDPAERDAVIINTALMGWIKDLAAVTEILYFRTFSEIENIRHAYHSNFSRSLEEDIGLKACCADEKKLLLAFIREDRPNVLEPDMSLAEADANDLLVAVSDRKDINKAVIIKIMSTRSPLQMKATLDHYKQAYKHSFEKVIKQEFKGSFQGLLRVAMKCAKNPIHYFAKALYKSMKGLGTDNLTLIRIVVMRAELDLKDIKAHFDQKYEKSLLQMIISDTSGSYRRFLMFLTGAQLSEIKSAGSFLRTYGS